MQGYFAPLLVHPMQDGSSHGIDVSDSPSRASVGLERGDKVDKLVRKRRPEKLSQCGIGSRWVGKAGPHVLTSLNDFLLAL